MVKVLLTLKNAVLRNGFSTSLSACGVDVVEDKETGADYMLVDGKNGGMRLAQKNGALVTVFQKPVDFRDVVSVLKRLGAEIPLWKGCPVVVNFSTGMARCVKGKMIGEKVPLTDLQQSLLRTLLSGDDGVDVDDVCMAVYGKVDVWARSNLDMLVYNLNKRLAGIMGQPKVIVKIFDEHSGRFAFAG